MKSRIEYAFYTGRTSQSEVYSPLGSIYAFHVRFTDYDPKYILSAPDHVKSEIMGRFAFPRYVPETVDERLTFQLKQAPDAITTELINLFLNGVLSADPSNFIRSREGATSIYRHARFERFALSELDFESNNAAPIFLAKGIVAKPSTRTA